MRKLEILKLVIIVILIIITLKFIWGFYQRKVLLNQGKPKDALKYKNTEVVSNFNSVKVGNKNIVYCSTFQIAWRELKKNLGKNSVIVEKNETVRDLNITILEENNINSNDCIALSGAVKDGIIKKIEEEKVNKFGIRKKTKLPQNRESIILYSYMQKNILFPNKFQEMRISFNDKNFKSFGIKKNSKNEDLIHNIEIIDYKNSDDFIIKIENSERADIIAAKIKNNGSLKRMVEETMKRYKNGRVEEFEMGDMLNIPVIKFNIKKSYDEIKGNIIIDGDKNKYIEEANQEITFLMWQEGIKLKSESLVSMYSAIADYPEMPKRLIFDKPFLIILKEKDGVNPYFVMWVANSELMVK